MKLIKPFGNRSISTVAVLLAISTFAVHDWNRISHHVVGLPTTEEKRIALWIFIVTLVVSYSVPLALAVFAPAISGRPRWPIYELVVIVVGVFLGLAFLFFGLPLPEFISEYQDVIGAFLTYVAAFFGYSFAVKKVVASGQAGSLGRGLASVGVMLMAGAVMFVVSWMVVSFE